MGRHSRKEPSPAPRPGHPEPAPRAGAQGQAPGYAPAYGQGHGQAGAQGHAQAVAPVAWPEPAVGHQGYVPQPRHEQAPGARGGHPEQREPGGAWGAATGTGTGAAYGDWRGAPRTRPAPAGAATAVPPRAVPPRENDTPAFGTPAVGFPQVTLGQPMASAATATTSTGSHRRVSVPENAVTATGSHRRVSVPESAVTATGSHRRIPAPRTPVVAVEEQPPPASGRGLKARTYAGMAAAAVTTVLAVVVAGQAASEGGDTAKNSARATGDASRPTAQGDAVASRSDGRPTPETSALAQAAPELSYEQKMAQRLPIDEKLKGPGTFDTVPGVASAPGKGQLIRYRVDVEQGLDLDPQLFAEAVHRTLNDDRSWAHGGKRTFERVPGGEADFVITLASPGTTGVWCRKSGLDTTIDNVSCDSASTDRVMINAYRWSQGSDTYGADQMFAYRQMLINHEVGHRLGHGHVSCTTPGALAPIMQQQTKSLVINGIQCKANPWVFPGS